MPQTHGPRAASPAGLRQALGYVPPRGAVGMSGGGIDVGDGPSPEIALSPLGPGTFLGNLGGTAGVPTETPYTFEGLLDVPPTFVGAALKYVRVNGGESGLEFDPTILLPLFLVANLPTPTLGRLAMVTDSTTTALAGLGLAPIGGGANPVPVFATGTGWIQL